jgi:hypothetical protein
MRSGSNVQHVEEEWISWAARGRGVDQLDSTWKRSGSAGQLVEEEWISWTARGRGVDQLDSTWKRSGSAGQHVARIVSAGLHVNEKRISW